MKGVVRAEKLEDPAFYIKRLLELPKKENIKKYYSIDDWEDDEDFLKKLAKKRGKLLKVIIIYKLFFEVLN